ncbi:protein-tyrosine phosphatase-like protein, partial [Pisolithus thermaeus]
LILSPSLYLEPCAAASSESFLSKNSITHVLSVGASPSTQVDGVAYQRLSINDSVSSSISKVTDTACDLINRALWKLTGGENTQNGTRENILVHCSSGISRSPMVITAYLMKQNGMTLKEALSQIIRVRPQTSLKQGFCNSCRIWEWSYTGACPRRWNSCQNGSVGSIF